MLDTALEGAAWKGCAVEVSTKRWPAILWIVRHGQSAGNVARNAAMEARLDRIALDARDVDIPLSTRRAPGAGPPKVVRRLPGAAAGRGAGLALCAGSADRRTDTLSRWRRSGGAALRLRSLLDTISLHYAGQRVLIVAHQVILLCPRYILEHLDEAQILAIDAEGDVANCSATEYRFDSAAGKQGGLVLKRYNDLTGIDDVVPVTRAKDPPVALRG